MLRRGSTRASGQSCATSPTRCGFLPSRPGRRCCSMPRAGFASPFNLEEWLVRATAPLREAPFTHEIVLAAQPLPHRDPADRFLAATAQVMNLTLVTSDELLLGLGTIRTMKN